jgi:hypothetical protein
MVVLSRIYTDARVARRAADDLTAAGVPERDVVLIRGRRVRDVRDEPVGEFAGPIAPDAPVGTFADRPVRRCQGAGTYAGDPDRQRQGSFADADSGLVITHDDAGEHEHVADHRCLRRILHDRAIDAETQDRILDELDHGHAIVLLELAAMAPDDAKARLDGAARAA